MIQHFVSQAKFGNTTSERPISVSGRHPRNARVQEPSALNFGSEQASGRRENERAAAAAIRT